MLRSVVDRSCAVSYLRHRGMLVQTDQDLGGGGEGTDQADSAVS